jgi:hypothetical protein
MRDRRKAESVSLYVDISCCRLEEVKRRLFQQEARRNCIEKLVD